MRRLEKSDSAESRLSIIDNPLNVKGDDGPAAFVGFQEEAVVGVVLPELVSPEPECSGAVEAIGQMVAGGLGAKGDVVFFGCEQLGVEATVGKQSASDAWGNNIGVRSKKKASIKLHSAPEMLPYGTHGTLRHNYFLFFGKPGK